jgi:endo-1,4-beta-xylanase
VAVTDGSTVQGWNTPGSLGTLQLVEPLSFTTIPEASVAPVIDGTKDAVWAAASTVTTNKLLSGSADGAKAKVYQLWKDGYLYVLADVTDATIDVSSPNAYEQDSVEIFTDLGNAKNGSYRADDAQMRISVDNAISFGAGDSEDAQRARLTSATSRTSTGYIVEARIDMKDSTGVGRFEGVDYEVNDGTNGARTSNVGWAEQTGTAYETTSRWGVAELVAPLEVAPVVTLQPADVTAQKNAIVAISAAAFGSPEPTVTWQRLTRGGQWVTVDGATSTTLNVKATPGFNGAQYRAVFTNSKGSVTSKAATLTVTR